MIPVNKYKEKDFDVWGGRGSIWGNPFILGVHGDRDRCIAWYKDHLWYMIKNNIVTKEDLLTLEGKKVACVCKPHACHLDILKSAVEWAVASKESRNEEMKKDYLLIEYTSNFI